MSPGKKPRAKKVTPPPTPKQPKPWDQPPHPKAGDETAEKTFTAVGRALSAWEEFEYEMSKLFANFIGANSNTLPASRAYGSVLTFRGRSEMIEAASEAYFFENKHPDIENDVKKILIEARGFAARRNEVAHGVVKRIEVPHRFLIQSKVRIPIMKNWGFAVVPSNYATNKNDLTGGITILAPVLQKPKYTYTSHEIDGFTEKFALLCKRTTDLGIRLFFHSMQV